VVGRDQLLHVVRRRVRVGLVVEENQLDLALLPADVEAAGRVDLADGVLIAPLLE